MMLGRATDIRNEDDDDCTDDKNEHVPEIPSSKVQSFETLVAYNDINYFSSLPNVPQNAFPKLNPVVKIFLVLYITIAKFKKNEN